MEDGDIFQNETFSGKYACFSKKAFSGSAYVRELPQNSEVGKSTAFNRCMDAHVGLP